MNKLGMPDDAQVEKCMTPEQRQERQERLANWRRSQDEDIAEETEK